MNHLKLLFIAALVLLPALSQAAEPAAYPYPFPGPYGATILGTPPQMKPELPKTVPSKELVETEMKFRPIVDALS
jgi:hypothetical protein